jgi:hypothetical protein
VWHTCPWNAADVKVHAYASQSRSCGGNRLGEHQLVVLIGGNLVIMPDLTLEQIELSERKHEILPPPPDPDLPIFVYGALNRTYFQ